MDYRELMAIRADTLFTYDARGRMLQSNEPRVATRRPAPRLFLGWMRDGFVMRLGATLSDEPARRVEAIVDRLPPPGDLATPPAATAGLRAALERQAPITGESAGPAYRFPDESAQSNEAVLLTPENVSLARETFPWLLDELADWWPCFAVVREGAAVSVCFSARMSARAAEAGVETLPDFRGHGFAGAVTAAWGVTIRARPSGRIPFYSTGWDNLASQSVARRLGLIQFGADATWT